MELNRFPEQAVPSPGSLLLTLYSSFRSQDQTPIPQRQPPEEQSYRLQALLFLPLYTVLPKYNAGHISLEHHSHPLIYEVREGRVHICLDYQSIPCTEDKRLVYRKCWSNTDECQLVNSSKPLFFKLWVTSQ